MKINVYIFSRHNLYILMFEIFFLLYSVNANNKPLQKKMDGYLNNAHVMFYN